MPSTQEYCAIGETTTRFFKLTPRSVKGVNIGGTARCCGLRCTPERWAIQSS
ncbi:hypothetical protein D3C80_1942980 [compost metagenome]